MSADLEARVAKLERTAKRRGLLAVVFGVLCVGLGAAQVVQKEARFETVRARQFAIEDAAGKPRGFLGFIDPGDGEGPRNVLLLRGMDGSSITLQAGMEIVSVIKADGKQVIID
jgi:hypothetical protein